MADAGRHPNIKVLTLSEVKEVSGYVGNFRVRVRRRAATRRPSRSRTMPTSRRAERPYNSPFDLRGFLFISIMLAAFQLMLDRGQMLDWMSSTEICIEAALAALFLYISIVHMLTVPNPFIQPVIFRDRNFLVGSVLSVLLGILLMSSVLVIATNIAVDAVYHWLDPRIGAA